MKIEKESLDFNKPMDKLVAGLIEGDDVSNFLIEKASGEVQKIQILLGDWNLELLPNGKWSIG